MKKVGFPTDGNSEVVEYRYLPALSTYLHIYQHYLDIYIFTYLPAISRYLHIYQRVCVENLPCFLPLSSISWWPPVSSSTRTTQLAEAGGRAQNEISSSRSSPTVAVTLPG